MPKPGKRFKDSKEHKYGDFRGGGLNLSASEFYLKENEYAACKNTCYERNGGRLRTLEPLDLVYTAAASVTSIFNSLAYGLFYVCGQSLYKFTNGVAAYLGELNGTETPTFADYGEETDRKVYIASGSVVQYYDGNGLYTQTPQPVDANNPSGDKWNSASDVLVREGRLLLARSGKDRLKFSGVGDPTDWQTEDNGEDVYTDADAVWVDIGYKQGGDIIRIVPVASDLIIFRTDGSLYRLSGTYPDWLAPQIGSNVSPINRDSVVAIGDDAMFVDKDRGLRKVSYLKDAYNDLSIAEKEGTKINPYLAAHVTSDCRMWTLPDRGEVWIRPNSGNTVFTYNSRYDGWNIVDLGTEVTAACEVDGVVYLALGTKICTLNDEAANVYLHPETSLSFAPIYSKDRVAAEYLQCRLGKDANAAAVLSVGGLTWALADGRNTKYQMVIGDSLAPVLTASGGSIVLDEFLMRTAEAV